MENSGASTQQTAPKVSAWERFKNAITKTNRGISRVEVWLYRLRKPVMAAPVVYYALKLAAYNAEHLPELVGLNLQSDGTFMQMISRDLAVTGPLALTGGCLLLMFCSRKAMYSWAISVFTLVLPILLLVSNVYPA